MHMHKENNKESRLIISAGLNFVTTIVQVVGGLLSGSLSLLSDALHNFSDSIALAISVIAVHQRPLALDRAALIDPVEAGVERRRQPHQVEVL